MAAIEKLMLKVHERLRASGEAPSYMAEAGEDSNPPPAAPAGP